MIPFTQSVLLSYRVAIRALYDTFSSSEEEQGKKHDVKTIKINKYGHPGNKTKLPKSIERFNTGTGMSVTLLL